MLNTKKGFLLRYTRESVIFSLRPMVYYLLGKNLGVLIRSTILTIGIHHCRLASAQLGGIMKLYSDRANPLLLRILAARNLSGVPLTVHFINDDGMSAFLFVCEFKMKVKCAIASQIILPLFVYAISV